MDFCHISRLIHTTRHLKPVQIYARLLNKIPKLDAKTGPTLERRTNIKPWAKEIRQKGKLLDTGEFYFLNAKGTLDLNKPWASPSHSLLWNYNLNYFDFLFEEGKEHLGPPLIDQWIKANRKGEYPSWAPYPSSLRIVNWIRYDLTGYALTESALESLSNQLRTLYRNIEYHIQANHLLTNGKALLFGGTFFNGNEAKQWFHKAVKILTKEIPEQTLSDGGNYERSPMYHSIVLKDLLDILNLLRCYDNTSFEDLTFLQDQCLRYSQLMFNWLKQLRHPNGHIPLFNDSALGIAPTFCEIEKYAQRLDLSWSTSTDSKQGLIDFPESGYFKYYNGSYCLIGDSAPVGPDYQPGHAHADTLTFELSIGELPVLVDTGTSTYTEHPRRDIERATHSHNTLTVNSLNSSDVWGHHRVARRARTKNRHKTLNGLRCSHDGYSHLKGVSLHTREWRFEGHKVSILDRVEGSNTCDVYIHFHLAPGLIASKETGNKISLFSREKKSICRIILPIFCVTSIEHYLHSPEFGRSDKALKVVAKVNAKLPLDLVTYIEICH